MIYKRRLWSCTKAEEVNRVSFSYVGQNAEQDIKLQWFSVERDGQPPSQTMLDINRVYAVVYMNPSVQLGYGIWNGEVWKLIDGTHASVRQYHPIPLWET